MFSGISSLVISVSSTAPGADTLGAILLSESMNDLC